MIHLPEGFEESEEEDLKPEMTPFETIKEAVMTIIRENTDEDDWVFIGDIGNMLLKRYPDFDVRNFGFKKLTPLIRSIDCVQIKTVKHGSSVLVYVKEKELAASGKPAGKK